MKIKYHLRFILFFILFLFETRSCYRALLLSLPSAGITGMNHHVQLQISYFKFFSWIKRKGVRGKEATSVARQILTFSIQAIKTVSNHWAWRLTPIISATWGDGDQEDHGSRPARQKVRDHISTNKLGKVFHVCNPNHAGGIMWKDHSPKLVLGKNARLRLAE
jgi:hypothetical protein